MNNNVLGLEIIRIREGYTNLLGINEDPVWTKKVWDIREDLKNIENLDDRSAVLILKGLEKGHLIAVATLIGGRVTDCISAWIYVPNEMVIDGKELENIVNITRKEILASQRNDRDLQEQFSKTYKLAPAKRCTVQSTGKECAYRYYGQGTQYTLAELLKDMDQFYYRDYKCILLLDRNSGFTCKLGNNLTDKKVYRTILKEAPKSIDGFIPKIKGEKFEEARYFIEDDLVEIVWEREGFEPIRTKTIIKKSRKWEEPDSSQYQRIIPFDRIIVQDESGKRINIDDLYIEDQRKSKWREITVPGNKNKWKIKIVANGYEDWEKDDCDLTQSLSINLSQLPRNEPLLSPIEDYSKKDDRKIDAIDSKKDSFWQRLLEGKRFFVIWGPVSVVALLIGFCSVYFVLKELYEQENNERLSGDRSTEVQSNNESVQKSNESSCLDGHLAAIQYLDNDQGVWNRDSMERFSDTKGLWDAMRERDFDEILKYEDKLGDSRSFKKVKVAVERNKHKEKNWSFYPRDPEDHDITIERYIKALEDAKYENPFEPPKKR